MQVGQLGTDVQVTQGVGSDEISVTGGPAGGVPVAVAKLFTCPASISAWVIVYVAVKVVVSEAPIAKEAKGPPKTFTSGSVTVILVRIALPVFVIVKL